MLTMRGKGNILLLVTSRLLQDLLLNCLQAFVVRFDVVLNKRTTNKVSLNVDDNPKSLASIDSDIAELMGLVLRVTDESDAKYAFSSQATPDSDIDQDTEKLEMVRIGNKSVNSDVFSRPLCVSNYELSRDPIKVSSSTFALDMLLSDNVWTD